MYSVPVSTRRLNQSFVFALGERLLKSTRVFDHTVMKMMFHSPTVRRHALALFSRLNIFVVRDNIIRLYSETHKDIFYCFDLADPLAYDYFDIFVRGVMNYLKETNEGPYTFLTCIYLVDIRNVNFGRLGNTLLHLKGVECLSLPYNFPITTKKQDKIIINMTRRFASSIRVMKHLNTSFLFLLPEKLKSEVAVINVRQLRCRDELAIVVKGRRIPYHRLNKYPQHRNDFAVQIGHMNFQERDQNFYAFYARKASPDQEVEDGISLNINLRKPELRFIKQQELSKFKTEVSHMSLRILLLYLDFSKITTFFAELSKIKMPHFLPALSKMDLCFVIPEDNLNDDYYDDNPSLIPGNMGTFKQLATISKEWLRNHATSLSFRINIRISLEVDYARSVEHDPTNKMIAKALEELQPDIQVLGMDVIKNTSGTACLVKKETFGTGNDTATQYSHESSIRLRTLTFYLDERKKTIYDEDTVFHESNYSL